MRVIVKIMETKICCTCKEDKPLDQFAKKKHLVNNECKSCKNLYNKEWYKKNKQKHRDQVNVSRKLSSKQKREQINKIKSVPCLDCGNTYPSYCMDFDHLENKEFGIASKITSYPIDRLLKEIAKCEIVCANCHRIRTYKRSCSPTAEAADLNPAQCQFESD